MTLSPRISAVATVACLTRFFGRRLPRVDGPRMRAGELSVRAPSQGDLALAIDLYGQIASLSAPLTGHTSRFAMERMGNQVCSQWVCKQCRQQLLVIRRRAPLAGVAIFLSPPPCSATSSPPRPPTLEPRPRGPGAKAIARGATPRAPTPDYPFLEGVNQTVPQATRGGSAVVAHPLWQEVARAAVAGNDFTQMPPTLRGGRRLGARVSHAQRFF